MDPSRPTKRQRRASNDSLPTPPGSEESDSQIELKSSSVLQQATHVLATEAAALARVTELYQTDFEVQQSFTNAISALIKSQEARGKLIVCAVGKSAYIGMKLVATCKSLGISSSFMHACEAAHGDLGDLRPDDVVLFVSFSGKTPELLNLLPHISPSTQLIAISSHCNVSECRLLRGRDTAILLPAPIQESEESSFGVGAPTTSTTVALAVADMLALTLAQQIHGREKKQEVFKRNHPGGAIGMNHREVEELKKKDPAIDVSILELPSPSISGEDC
jgi:D-arabinose 5-phosphate isomerase GutQ